jgi:S-formylglutathione hydrolase FrmB
MIMALKHPELFAAGAALSAAVWDDSSIVKMPDGVYDRILGQLYGRGLKGGDRVSAVFVANSPIRIVGMKTADELKKVRYWIDCGDDDGLSKGNCLLHIALMDKGVPHEFRVRDGAHTWTYWRTGITDGLAFIGQSFHQQ